MRPVSPGLRWTILWHIYQLLGGIHRREGRIGDWVIGKLLRWFPRLHCRRATQGTSRCFDFLLSYGNGWTSVIWVQIQVDYEMVVEHVELPFHSQWIRKRFHVLGVRMGRRSRKYEGGGREWEGGRRMHRQCCRIAGRYVTCIWG